MPRGWKIFMDPVDCPCLSQKKYAACCQPFLLGKAVAPTAELLMRSRYTAYTQGHIDYVNDTLAPEERKTFDRKSATEWSKRSQWLGLEIQSTEEGQPGDAKGMVEFTANFVMDGKKAAHHEKALFRFDEADKCWYFVEPEGSKNMPIVKPPEPGRNDPCSCGSGKKYKKCHGLAH